MVASIKLKRVLKQMKVLEMHKFKGTYTKDWAEISEAIKRNNNYRCERCKHPHDPENGYALTVHHLDGDKSNNADWNLACLCQRCHLHAEGFYQSQLVR
jgi:5-methylcytosine-specific restriction endonuclease McrA